MKTLLCGHAACDMRAVARVSGHGPSLVLERANAEIVPAGTLSLCRVHTMNAVSIGLEVWSQ